MKFKAAILGIAAALGVIITSGAAFSQTTPPLLAERNGPCNYGGNVRTPEFFTWLGHSGGGLAMDFVDTTSWSTMVSSTATLAGCWHTAGFTNLTFAVPLVPTGVNMHSGIGGEYNSIYQSMGQSLVNNGFPNAIIRLGLEPNLNSAAAADPASYIALFQQAVNTFRAVPGNHFKIDWCISLGAGTYPATGGHLAPDHLFPGTAYVDVYGIDWYDTYWQAPPKWNTWMTENYGPNWLVNFAPPGALISIPEWGMLPLSSGFQGDDPTFIIDVAGWIATHNVLYTGFWGEDSSKSNLEPSTTTVLPGSAYQFPLSFTTTAP